MALIAGGMLLIFVLGGLSVLWLGLQDLWLMMRVRPRLLSASGVVLRVYSERKPTSADSKFSHFTHYPEIRFQNQRGEAVTFRSEVGEATARRQAGANLFFNSGQPKNTGYPQQYHTGQTLPVLYDPQGEVSPRLHTWSAVWGMAIFELMGGLTLMSGGVLVWVAFGDHLVNTWWGVAGSLGFS